MTAKDLYALAEDVQIIPVGELDAQTLTKFEYDENDFVLTYSNSRTTSKVINPASASMLKEFKAPKSLAEVVFRYSFVNKLNPKDTLEESYPLFAQLRNEGFLVLYDENAPKVEKNSLKPGDPFRDFEIVARIQSITDTEVYKIKQGDHFFALKLLRPGANSLNTSENYYNELDIISHLDGKINPSLIESGEYNTQHYMILEWCDGISSDREAENYRNLHHPENFKKLIHLCYSILEAYKHLHKQGVIHSDIHPRNIIIGANGAVKIIDFGISRIEPSTKYIARAGIGFFFEPEYAETVIHQQMQPASSFLGEQYALGTLMYLLITGKHYLNFSFEREKLFNQILSESPIPFTKYDIDTDPEIESCIFKALSKNPIDRYTSVSVFAEELARIQRKQIDQVSPLILQSKYSHDAFCSVLKSRYGFDGAFIKKGLQLPPVSSVSYGSAGIAYMFYRMAVLEADPELLALADIWINRASNYRTDQQSAFYSPEIEITQETVGTNSLYHTGSGVQLVQALISNSSGNQLDYQQSVMGFMMEASQPCDNLDLTLGKSGVLIGCAILFRDSFSKKSGLMNELKSFGDKIMKEIWNKLDDYTLLQENNPINYRGIAHGWAGILYATLRWCHESKTELPANYFSRIEQLINLGLDQDKMLRWNLSNTNEVSWPGWCHGSAGYTFLLTLLYQYTNDGKFIAMAEKATRHFLLIDKEGTNGSLCCGLAGEAYALLNIYKATENSIYLEEAKQLSKRILHQAYAPVMRNNSLYKGDVGIGVLFSELNKPGYALMPLFE